MLPQMARNEIKKHGQKLPGSQDMYLVALNDQTGNHQDFVEALEVRQAVPCCWGWNMYNREIVDTMAQVLTEGTQYHFYSAAMSLNQQDYPVPAVVADSGNIQKCRQIVKRPASVSPEASFLLTTVSCEDDLSFLYVIKDDFTIKKARTWAKLYTARRLFMTAANVYALISIPGYTTGISMNPLAVSLLHQLTATASKPLTSTTVTQLMHTSDQIHAQILIAKLSSQLQMASARVRPTETKLKFISLISLILGGDLYPLMAKEQAGTLLTLYLLLIFNVLLITITYITRPCRSTGCISSKSKCCKTC